MTPTGMSLSVVLPLPSWPSALSPQASTRPGEARVPLWLQPARTDVTLVPWGTLTVTGMSK